VKEKDMLPQDLLNQLFNTLSDGTTLVKFAALLLVLVQFVKPIATALIRQFTDNKDFVIEGDAARYLALAVQVVVWVLYVFAQQRGQEQQFTDLATVIQGILNSIAPLLPVAVVTNLAASATYDYLNDKSVPGFQTPTSQKALKG